MGEGDTEQPQISPHNGGGSHHFPVGSPVEVLVNDKDFGGVYFTATVVPLSRKIDPENSGKLYVKYQNLLAREGRSDRLREYVDISTVRPAPPLHKTGGRFEANDVVDAFYKDGWWTGVVSRVVGGGKRFVVRFENPPDEVELGLSKLRAHWDWVDGAWAWPQRKGGMGNVDFFEVGGKVEISIERDGDDCDFKGAWFPAAIVRNLENGVYLVELKDKNGGRVLEEVDCVHIRPSPPIFQYGGFRALEKVDAFVNFGWWSGLIKKKDTKNGYIVFFEHTKLNKLFDRSELRPHLEWKDGKWLICGITEAPPLPLTPNSKRRRESTSSDSGVSKHKPHIEHANPKTKHIVEDVDDFEYDQERRSKRREDVQTPSHIDCSSMQQLMDDDSRAPNSAQQIVGRHEIDQEKRNEDNMQKLPFVKRNAIWKSIEAMKALQRMPQRPHFEPLRRFKESQREGLAIGCMVTFANVVEASQGLKFSDPKSVVDELHETLLDLETHGFQVGVVNKRVIKLVAAKEEEERLVDQAKRIKEEIEERRGRREKIEGEMRVINEHMRRLLEQLELAEMDKAKEVEEIARLSAGLEEKRQQMESVMCDFEGVAASIFNGDR